MKTLFCGFWTLIYAMGYFESRRLDWDMIIIGFNVFGFVVFNIERLD